MAGFKPEIGIAYRFLDRRRHFFLPRRHADGARIDQRHVGDLRQRRRRAVVVDHHVIENAGVGAAGAHFAEVVLERSSDFFIFCSAVFLTSAIMIGSSVLRC